MDVKEKVKLTMSSINRKITALIMAMTAIGVKLAAYTSKDGSVLVNTPNDVIAVGDAVLVEQDGVVNDKATWEGKIIGADAEYQVVIVDGVVKELTKIESESKESIENNSEQQPQQQVVEQSQIVEQVTASMNRVIAVNEVLLKEVERLNSEINEIKKQNSTLWATMQKSTTHTEKQVQSKFSRLREIYNNV
jgi:hypothetical protein